MTFLSISTSGLLYSVASFHQGEFSEISLEKTRSLPCDALIELIETLSKKQGFREAQIEKIVVDQGPGSYTGIRVGVSTANGLALGWKVPVLGFSSLDLMAEEYRRSCKDLSSDLMVGMNAGRDQLYASSYSLHSEKIQKKEPDRLMSKEIFLEEAASKAVTGLDLEILGISGRVGSPRALCGLHLAKQMTSEKVSTEKPSRFVQPHYVRSFPY